ncbi:acyl-CoA dehydrogenase family protein [Chloroflexota bacterium]
MNFKFTENQSSIVALAKKFNQSELEPIATKIDSSGKLPKDIIVKMAKVGLLGMCAPESYGGAQAGTFVSALACEQLAFSGTGAWWLVGFCNSITDCIAQFGNEFLKEKYIRRTCEGRVYPSFQFTEEETGSDPNAFITKAIPNGDVYIINGKKRFSTFGARNGYALVFAKDDAKLCSVFIVNKKCEGYVVLKKWDLMGSGGIEAVDIEYRDICINNTNLLGSKGKGLDVLRYWIAIEKIQQCAACVGIAQAAYEEAVRYTKSRKMKGTPLSHLQGIRWLLADMYAKIEAARLLTYKAANLKDRAVADWEVQAAASKLFVVPTTQDIVLSAKRIHGSYAYTKGAKIERLYRAIAGADGIATSLELNKSIVSSYLLS